MFWRSKNRAVASDSIQCLAENKTGKHKHSIALAGLQELREIAWQKALKYRFDPVLGQTHEEYLQALNGLIKECIA